MPSRLAAPTLVDAVRAIADDRVRGFVFVKPDGTEKLHTFHDLAAEAERRALRLLNEFGLASRANELAAGQPYGALRLVEMARNLMRDAEFLLLDEPGAGLTDDERSEVAGHIRQVAARGIGVLLIDHNLELINAVCQRMYVMDTGELVASGLPDEVFANERVIAAYLGVPQ